MDKPLRIRPAVRTGIPVARLAMRLGLLGCEGDECAFVRRTSNQFHESGIGRRRNSFVSGRAASVRALQSNVDRRAARNGIQRITPGNPPVFTNPEIKVEVPK